MPDSFKVAVFSNVNHLRTIVHSNEVKDSVWLLPKASTLDEVVVYGKRGKLAQQFALPKISDPAMKQNKPSNMHFLQSIYKALHPGKRKQKERDRKIL